MNDAPSIADNPRHPARLLPLDGWRAISILLVLATHMLPVGPREWCLNAATGVMGMSIFFSLSGFLIANMLWKNQDIAAFLVKRLMRILPLAWTYLIVVLTVGDADWEAWCANMFFYANIRQFHIYLAYAGHFWSLCVEMQFYMAIAAIVAIAGRTGLLLTPLLAVAVTILRIVHGVEVSIVTWYRVDEILVGSTLALIANGQFNNNVQRLFRAIPLPILMILFAISCHEWGGSINYLRPYLTMLMVGNTLFRKPGRVQSFLAMRSLAYVAKISYALYVLHGVTMLGWLGSGDKLVKYLKRPLCFLLTFALAHISTFYFEKPFNDLGHRWARNRSKRRGVPSLQPSIS